jgi:hypothetical protein
MSTYNGQFQVVNLTGGPITKVLVSHNGSAWIPTDAPLANGAIQGPTSFQSETGVDDDWSVSFVDASGNTWSRDDKQCNYEEEDAGETMLIIFYQQNFTLLTPQSDPCLNNAYSQS